ncbi:hypothetical protein Q5O24_11465 [Eubacteriaceae bacterium ES3]|nr:hypothetical protein Q5O24_11465 [Eubacteriaceae bacterium ES3]
MKKIEMEGALSRAVNQAPLLDFKALSAMPVEKMDKHDWITMPRKKKCINLKPISAVAASFLVGVVVYSGWFAQFKMADSVIGLDVNQSVEIITNRQNKVLSVRPLNALGEKVIAGKDFKQADLNESVNTIVNGLIEYGYLNEADKTILVSVKNSDVAKADQLVASVSETIEKTADAEAISPTILNQTYDKIDTAEEELAESLNVTTGKMNVITVMNQADESLELEALAAMSMDQLIQVSDEKNIDLSSVIKTEEADKVKNSLESSKETGAVEVEDAEEADENSDDLVVENAATSKEDPSSDADQSLDGLASDEENTEETVGGSGEIADETPKEVAGSEDKNKQSLEEEEQVDLEDPPDKISQSHDKDEAAKDPDEVQDQDNGRELAEEELSDLSEEESPMEETTVSPTEEKEI